MDISYDAQHALRLDFLQEMVAITMGIVVAQTGGDAERFAELHPLPPPDNFGEKELAALNYIRGVRKEFYESVARTVQQMNSRPRP